MKVKTFKEFRDRAIDNVTQYLAREMASNLRELQTLLTRLDFINNFKGFSVTVTIDPGDEIQITNRLDTIPTRRIVTRISGNSNLLDGNEPWTLDNLYLRNSGGSQLTADVTFME